MIEIAKKIENAGGRLYLVGGAVRDSLMGREIHDEDYCVTGLTTDEFKRLFPEAKIRGKSFEVFDLDGKEVAMARIESKSGIGHKEFKIETDKNITIEQDLARRDVTINSIAKDVLTGKIIDPFNGKEDLKNKILRATTDKFKEDPLRVYRVARMSACFEFVVEEKTLKMMESLKEELSTLSKERVFYEFRKALNSDKPSIFFEVLKNTNLLDVHFKEIKDLIGAEQPIKYHPEGDSYNHTMQVVDKACMLTDNEVIRYACLVHDLGKGVTPKENYPHHYGHDKLGVTLVENFSNRINVPNSWKKAGKTSCKEHMRGGIFSQMTPKKKLEFLENVYKSELGLEGMQIVVTADRWRFDEKPKIDNFAKNGKKIFSEITGEDIIKEYGNIDGIKIKEILRQKRLELIKEISK